MLYDNSLFYYPRHLYLTPGFFSLSSDFLVNTSGIPSDKDEAAGAPSNTFKGVPFGTNGYTYSIW